MNARVAIIGSRSMPINAASITNMEEELSRLKEMYRIDDVMEILSGGAQGADSVAELLAMKLDIPITIFPAKWKVHGKSAGYKRNVDIVNNATHVLAFWDGESKGTKHSIDLAEKNNKPVLIVDL